VVQAAAKVSIKELLEKDAEDESLRKYKAALIGAAAAAAAGSADAGAAGARASARSIARCDDSARVAVLQTPGKWLSSPFRFS
jgi:hypothetical protein